MIVTAKLSTDCISCGSRHTAEEMSAYVERKLARGKDPLAAPHGGFRCSVCVMLALDELLFEERDEAAAHIEAAGRALDLHGSGRSLARILRTEGPIALEHAARSLGRACRAEGREVFYDNGRRLALFARRVARTVHE